MKNKIVGCQYIFRASKNQMLLKIRKINKFKNYYKWSDNFIMEVSVCLSCSTCSCILICICTYITSVRRHGVRVYGACVVIYVDIIMYKMRKHLLR